MTKAQRYGNLSKKVLIDRLIKAERQLRKASEGLDSTPADSARKRSETAVQDKNRPASPAGLRARTGAVVSPAEPVESSASSERNFTVVDKDGLIRRLYEVVQDVRDPSGRPRFTEGALYEVIPSQSGAAPGESDQTELVCRFRPDGTVIQVNDAYCRYFGTDKEGLHGRNVLFSVSEADRERVYSSLKGLGPEHPVDTLEHRVVTVFGDVLWNQWTYRALFDTGGNILEYHSVGRDITFRKYTQDVLERRAAILEAVAFAAEVFLKSSSWRGRIGRVLERFGTALEASHAILFENQFGEDGVLAVRRGYEWLSPEYRAPRNQRRLLRSADMAVRFSKWVYEKSEGKPVFGSIGNFPEQVAEELKLDRQLSIAVVPLLVGNRWWGFIGFADYSGARSWTDEEIAPLETVAEIFAAAIERETREKKLEEAHEELQEQERFLAGVFDAIQDGIMVAAPDMTILRVNSAMEKRFPHAPNLPGRKCYEAFYGLKNPCCECAVQETIKTGKAASMTRSILDPDGECRGWVEVFSYPWVDHETGRLKGVIEYSRDITERKRAEEELANTRVLLGQAFEQSPHPMALVSMPDMVIRIANPAIREYFGIMDEPTPVGQSLLQMKMSWTDCDPQGNPIPLQDLPLPRALMGHKTVNQEIMAVTKDGTVRHELVSGVPIRNSRGDILAGYLVCTDISERKRAEEARRQTEERLQTFLNSFRDPVFLKDSDRRYLFVNDAGLSLLGRTREEILGKTDAEMFDAADAAEQEKEKRDLALLSQDGAPLLYEQRIKDRLLETTKFRVTLEDGRIGIGGILRDVTENVAAQEALRASEERYRELADTIPVGVYEADMQGHVVYANRTAQEMFGYGAHEITPSSGVHFLRIIAPEHHASAIDLSRRVREDRTALSQEYTFVRKDGSRFTGLITSRPMIRDGQVAGSRGVCTDISALKEAQRALRENEAMLQGILQAAPIGISFGENRILKWVNEQYQQMTGYGTELLEGNSARVLYDSDEEFLRVGEAFYRGIDERGIGTTEARWTRKDGSKIDVLLSMSPIFPEDAAKGVVVTALDITEQKKADEALRASEARYRELADNMPAGIYEATLDGRVTYANRTALEMFGFSADEIERGVPFTEVIAPESRGDLARNVRKIRDGEAFDFEYAMLRRDGSRFFGLILARPVIKDGRVVGSTGVVSDVTELRKVQEALRNNEALLGSILQVAPIGVGMVRDRVLGWVNEGVTALTGYHADELRGQSARMLYPDDGEFERVGREEYAEIRARGKGAIETRWRRKDGAVIDIHLSAAPIDTQNLAAGIVFTALDITVQKKAARILLFAKADLEKQVAEQTRELDVTNMLLRIELEEHRKTEDALVKSEQVYRAIVEDQTEIICRFRPDGTISFVNEAFCRFFGKDRAEVLGSRYLPTIPREDRKKLWTAYGALAPHRPVFHMEFRIEMPDGALRWLHWTNRAIYGESGTLIEHQGVGRDITERILSEQQIRESRNMLRSVFDGISDPLIMVREDLTLIMLNRAALRFFDAPLYRDLIGNSCLEFLQGRYGLEETNLVLAGMTEREPARCELATKGDSARYEELFIYPVQAGGGEGSMAIIRITDRTKQRLMERELIQSERLASLGLLISGIVHEINNPNNFISFNIPILRDYLREILPILDEYASGKPDYEVQGMPYAEFRADVMKLLENIEHGSTRINTTVSKLKEFSRKKDERGARSILPSDVIEKAVAICHTQIRKTVKTFDVQVQPDMPETVTDPDAIEQTLINLLINAAQASDKPDSYIRFRATRGATDASGLVMEVEDNGCGMDQKTASRIFEPFYTTKEEGLGTGLGLYISKNLIESVGGSVTVESEIGRGTTFRVVIPDLGNTRKKQSEKQGVDS